MTRIGILTSGGDCPGLNAVIRGAVLKGTEVHAQEFIGFLDGWRGLVDGDVIPLDRSRVRGLAQQGGTILGTSRFGPYQGPNGGARNIQATLDRLGIDAVIAIGGEGTASASKRLFEEGIRIVGVPKTIDNDLSRTDYTFGFDTAVEIATVAIDRLRTTGNSHKRCMVLEVMGRHAGWIALHSGTAGGAHAILIPEHPESLEQICAWVTSVRDRGRAPMVVVAEGFTLPEMTEAHSTKGLDGFDRPRLGGIAELLAPLIEEHTGSRHARRCSGTFSAVVSRPRSTGSSPHGSVWPSPTWWPTRNGGTWWPCTEPTSRGSDSRRLSPTPSTCRTSATRRCGSSSAEAVRRAVVAV